MAIQKFSTAELLALPLKPWGPGKPFDADPPGMITGSRIRVANREGGTYGVWEASPGTFIREVGTGEYMHIFSGECTFTTEEGVEIPIGAGDSLFFPPNTKGVWRVKTPLRKVFVML